MSEVTDAYLYTVDKVIENFIALEDHFKDYPCWGDCIPKHLHALSLYLNEAIDLAPPEHKEFWIRMKDEFSEWITKLSEDGNQIEYAEQARAFRKRVMHELNWELQQIRKWISKPFEVLKKAVSKLKPTISNLKAALSKAKKAGKSIVKLGKETVSKLINSLEEVASEIQDANPQVALQLESSADILRKEGEVIDVKTLDKLLNIIERQLDIMEKQIEKIKQYELHQCLPCAATPLLPIGLLAAIGDKKECPPCMENTDGYCVEELRPLEDFDPRSIRSVKRDGHVIKVGCLKGYWNEKEQRCEIGTEAHSIWHPKEEVREEWEKHVEKCRVGKLRGVVNA